jgi:hypothetical protein
MTQTQLSSLKARLDAEWTFLHRNAKTDAEREIQAAVESALSALDRAKMKATGREYWTEDLWD